MIILLILDVLNINSIICDKITSTNTDKKFVKSLSIIWEEERIRRRKEKINSQPTPIDFEQTLRTVPQRSEIEEIMYEKLEKLAQDDLPEIHYTCPFISSQIEKQEHYIDEEDDEVIQMLDWMRNNDPENLQMNEEQIQKTQKEINDIMECSLFLNQEIPDRKDYPDPKDIFSQLDGYESNNDFKSGDFVYLRAPKNQKRPFIGYIKSIDSEYVDIIWFLYPDEIESKISFEEKEIIASEYSDRNKIKTIIGKCKIYNEIEFIDHTFEEHSYFCRYEIQKDMKILPISKEKRKLFWKEIIQQEHKIKDNHIEEDEDIILPPTQINTPPKQMSLVYKESPEINIQMEIGEKQSNENIEISPDLLNIENQAISTPERFIEKESLSIDLEFSISKQKTLKSNTPEKETPKIQEEQVSKMVEYQKPYFSNIDDAIKAQKSKYDIKKIPKFKESESFHNIIIENEEEYIYEYLKNPPDSKDLLKDFQEKKKSKLKNIKIGFKSSSQEKENLSILSVEIHGNFIQI